MDTLYIKSLQNVKYHCQLVELLLVQKHDTMCRMNIKLSNDAIEFRLLVVDTSFDSKSWRNIGASSYIYRINEFFKVTLKILLFTSASHRFDTCDYFSHLANTRLISTIKNDFL